MLTLNLMRHIQLKPVPHAQIFVACVLLAPDYNKPGKSTKVTIEGLERIPKTGRVFLAMNHTDRYNYFPFQYKLWRLGLKMFTATWVKGKYFNHPGIAKFMVSTNNIPTPSRGYILASDVVQLLGKPPGDVLYRLLRTTFNQNAQSRDLDSIREEAKQHGILATLERILQTPRNILGLDFNPRQETYFDAIDRLFTLLMTEFISLNEQAFAHNNKIIVFPEGTRSTIITKGRTGLAQMALRMKATIVPIGCSGSDVLYPGRMPFSTGGEVIYRIGEPMTPDGVLSPFQIEESYTPFTMDATLNHNDKFEGATELIMARITELVDPQYRPEAGQTNEVQGANRFL